MSMLQSHRLSAILLAKSAASTPTPEPVLAAAEAGTASPVEEAVTGANEPVVSPEEKHLKKLERRRQIMAVLLPTLLGGAYGGAVGSPLLAGNRGRFSGSAALTGAGVGAGLGAGIGGAKLLLAKYLGIDPLTNVQTHMKTASSRLAAVKLAQALHEMETKEATGLARLAFKLGPRAVSGLKSLGRQATRWGGNPALGNTGLRSYVSRAGRYADEWQKPLQAPIKGSYRTRSSFERAQRGYANRVKERPAGWDARQGKVVNTKPTPEAAQAPGRMGRAWDWYKNSPKAQLAGTFGSGVLGWTGMESIVGGAREQENQARGAAAALQYYQQMPMWQKLMMSFQGPEAMQQYVPRDILPFLQELQQAQQYRI